MGVLISDAKQVFLSANINPIVHEGGDGHCILTEFISADQLKILIRLEYVYDAGHIHEVNIIPH